MALPETRREWLCKLLADGRLTAHFARVGVAVMQAVPMSGRATVRLDSLMAATGTSEPTVRHAIARLDQLGYITARQGVLTWGVQLLLAPKPAKASRRAA